MTRRQTLADNRQVLFICMRLTRLNKLTRLDQLCVCNKRSWIGYAFITENYMKKDLIYLCIYYENLPYIKQIQS